MNLTDRPAFELGIDLLRYFAVKLDLTSQGAMKF
jgi:hypothetical protein